METVKTDLETKESIDATDAVLELQRDMVHSEINDIIELRSLVGVKLSDIDPEHMPEVLKRGPLGVLLMDGKVEIAERAIERWSVHFAKNIDNLLKAVELLPNYPDQERRALPFAQQAATTMTNALGRALKYGADRQAE